MVFWIGRVPGGWQSPNQQLRQGMRPASTTAHDTCYRKKTHTVGEIIQTFVSPRKWLKKGQYYRFLNDEFSGMLVLTFQISWCTSCALRENTKLNTNWHGKKNGKLNSSMVSFASFSSWKSPKIQEKKLFDKRGPGLYHTRYTADKEVLKTPI